MIRNTEPHQYRVNSQPPTTGPIPIPRPETPAQIPIARPRSSAGKTFVRIDSVEGMINAPPMPMIARVKISIVADPANADATEPAPNTSSPAASAYRRP